MLAEFLEGLRFAMAGDPLRRGHQHPTIFRRHRQRDKRGIVVIAIAKRNVHRIFKHVGQLIGKEQPQAQRRVALAEIAEQGQEQVTPEVRRHGNLQHAANFIIRGLDLLQTGLEGIEHLGGVGQPGLPLRRQAQAAGRTGKQANIEDRLQTLNRRADLRRLLPGLARRVAKTAQRRGADK